LVIYKDYTEMHGQQNIKVQANLLFRLGTTLWLLRKSVKVNLQAFLTSEPDETQSSPLRSGLLNYKTTQKKGLPVFFEQENVRAP
jgi:hypothetical protein